MSGHSKWSTIKHKKAATDAKKGKEFSRVAKEITLAAKTGGGDPNMNSSLALAIERAKTVNMPNANIERAIKSGTGELKDAAAIEEIMYEGYGPGGIAVYIRAVTDNKNRSVSNIRHVLSKYGGSLGTNGSVSFMFQRKGSIEVPVAEKDAEELTLEVIDCGAEDVQDMGDTLLVLTDATALGSVKQKIDEAGITSLNQKITYIPDSTTVVDDEGTAQRIVKMMNILEEDDDVDEVYSNFDIPEELLEKLNV